jgi:hypothetical protein
MKYCWKGKSWSKKIVTKVQGNFFYRMLMHVFISLHLLGWNAMHPY